MPEKWTGNLIGRLHNERITFDELAAEVGWSKAYISMILNGARSPAGAKEKLEAAVDSILAKRTNEEKTDGTG